MAALATTGFVHARMDTEVDVSEATLAIPDPETARWSALGFEPVLADYYWVQGLNRVGGSMGRVDGAMVGELIDLVTTLDPWVDHPYRFAAVWMTGDLDQVERANHILERGIAYHPDDWRNRFHLGYNLFYYLQDNAEAARTLEPAIHMEGAPRYLGAFVTRLQADGGDLESAAVFLSELIRGATDEYARAEYQKAFDEIETERRARYLDEARVAFWERRGRDIEKPEDLWTGSGAVVERVPPPHPHFQGFRWKLDAESNEIVSTYYGQRYRLYIHSADEELRAQWRDEMDRRSEGGEG